MSNIVNLSSADQFLIKLCRRAIATDDRFAAVSARYGDVVEIPERAEAVLCDLTCRLYELRDAIRSMPPTTLEGARALALWELRELEIEDDAGRGEKPADPELRHRWETLRSMVDVFDRITGGMARAA